MADLLKPLASWPFAALVFGIVFIFAFRQQLSTLIARITEISSKGVRITNQTSLSAQKSGAEELLSNFDNSLLLEREKVILNELSTRDIVDPAEREKILIKHLAGLGIAAHFERAYYLIWGSQILLLQLLNQNISGLTVETLLPLHEQAAGANPTLYEQYNMDKWLGFLEGFEFITRRSGNIQITNCGREFLKYLIQQGYTLVKDG